MKQIFPLVLIMSLVSLCGCDQGIDERRATIKKECAMMSLDSDALAVKTTSCSDRLLNVIVDTHGSEGLMVSDLGNALASIKLPNTTFDDRLDALDRYQKLISHISENMVLKNIPSELMWKFRLKMLHRIQDEIELCKNAPEKCARQRARSGDCGFMTRRQYLDMLQLRKFEAIRSSFETGEFTLYFKKLPVELKTDWISHLAEVAHREIRIFDADHPVPLPPYVPEDNREWVPKSDGSAPTEYTEYFGDGTSFRMKTAEK